jgi:hypothetical protein
VARLAADNPLQTRERNVDDYSALIPARRITFDHFAASLVMKRLASVCEVGHGSAPNAISRCLTSGNSRMRVIS